MTRMGVLGTGEVGRTLAAGLKKHGYEVRIGSRTPSKIAEFAANAGIRAGTFAEVAAWAEGIVLAVAGGAAMDVVELAGPENFRGKVVLDTTNPISDEPPEDGVLHYFTEPNTSLMEQLQSSCPDARFVKVFNSVGAGLMVNPQLAATPTMFYCGNDEQAKAQVAAIVRAFGWEPADMGTAKGARAIEPLAVLWCIPGFRENRWSHAFHVLQA